MLITSSPVTMMLSAPSSSSPARIADAVIEGRQGEADVDEEAAVEAKAEAEAAEDAAQ